MTRAARYRRAIGLEYRSAEMDSPAVNVKAEQLRADELVRIAERYGIPIVEDRTLAQALSAMEIDQHIPAELYEAVALVLRELDSGLSRSKPRASLTQKPAARRA